jgi:hypothetical protein
MILSFVGSDRRPCATRWLSVLFLPLLVGAHDRDRTGLLEPEVPVNREPGKALRESSRRAGLP